MRVTKHEHACLVVEEQGHKLVVDPGMYSEKLPELTNVVALTLSPISTMTTVLGLMWRSCLSSFPR